MKLIDQLMDKLSSTIEGMKKPFIVKKIKRAYEASIEAVEEKKVELELQRLTTLEELIKRPEDASSYIKRLAAIRNEMNDCDATIDYLKQDKKMIFDEVKEDT